MNCLNYKIAEIVRPRVIREGELYTIVRFDGDPCNSLVRTRDLCKYPLVCNELRKPRRKEKVEVNLYDIHIYL